MSAYAGIADKIHWFPLPGFPSPLELLEKRTRLEQDEFTICVAGQLKAGKSTLLNALLFKDDVLPAFPTAMTAAITRIEHASRSPTGQAGFQAAYYTEEEWPRLKEKYRASEAIESFEADVEKARLAGVNEWELFGRAPQFHAGFDHLNEYVASMDNGGRYTPYVREAILYYDHPALLDLTIVDTPGTNDPNVVREAIATAYLSKADAVLFATYAGRVLDQNDLSLLTRYMGHMDAARVIFVITKVDVPFGSRQELDEYINSDLRKNDVLRPYLERGHVVPVCAEGALLGDMEAAGKLDAKGGIKLVRYRKLGFADAEAAGIKPLNDLLSTVLIQRKEETVLGSHRATLRSLVNGRYRDLGAKLADKRRALEDTESSSATLEKERSGITALTRKYQDQSEALAKQLAPRFGRLMSDFKRYCQERATRLPGKVAGMMNFNSPKQIKERLAIVFKGQLDDLMADFHMELGERLEREARDIRSLIRQELTSLDASSPIPVASLDAIITQAMDALPQLEMDDLAVEVRDTANGVYEDVYWFFNRWFDIGLFVQEDAKKQIEQQLCEKLEASGTSPVERFITNVSAHLDQGISSQIDSLLGNQIKDYLNRRQKDLERIANAGADLERLKRELDAECTALEVAQAEINGDTVLQPFLEEKNHA